MNRQELIDTLESNGWTKVETLKIRCPVAGWRKDGSMVRLSADNSDDDCAAIDHEASTPRYVSYADAAEWAIGQPDGIDYDEQCSEHGCARWCCDEEHV